MANLDPRKFVLDHIAIAVSDLEKAVGFYTSLGHHFEKHREVVEEQKVQTAFAPIDQHAHLELLMPTSSESPIAQFIQKKGEGIHHICYQVENIEQKTQELKAQGVQFIYPMARIGAKGRLVNFIHPKSSGGVLIELSQIQ